VTALIEAPPADPPAPEVAKPPKAGRAPLNPVLARELRVRLRGGRAWILLSAYLVVLAAIVFLVYQAESGITSGDPFSAPSPTRFAAVGRSVFEWLVFFMLLIVLFLVPGLTSGAIAGERDRQTLVPLQVTLLRPWQVMVGKLGASFAFLALLVLATAPLLSITYLIGGVTIDAVLRGIAVVLFTGVALTCVSLCCSAVFRRVQTATVASYGLVLLLVFGTMLAWAGAGILDGSRGSDPRNPPEELLALNPLFTAADVLDDEELLVSASNISSPFQFMVDILNESRYGTAVNGGFIEGDFGFAGPVPVPGRAGGFFVGGGFDGGGGFGVGPTGRPIIGFDQFGNPIEAVATGFPFWATSVIALYVLAVLAMLFAITRLRTPAKSER
jgi:ABC-type transport system involved in multi-copper enzyme maturation permease subunit